MMSSMPSRTLRGSAAALLLALAHVSPAHSAWLTHAVTRSSSGVARCASPLLMGKKPFKGGRLDDFLSAGEAEVWLPPAPEAWVPARRVLTRSCRSIHSPPSGQVRAVAVCAGGGGRMEDEDG